MDIGKPERIIEVTPPVKAPVEPGPVEPAPSEPVEEPAKEPA